MGSDPLHDDARPPPRPAAAPAPAGAASTLSKIMAIYIAIAVGRVGTLIPGLGGVPLARIFVVIAFLAAFNSRDVRGEANLRSSPVSRAALYFFALAVFSISYSFLRSGTLQVIEDSVLVCGVALFLIMRAAGNWASLRMMLVGCVYAAAALAIQGARSYGGGRAGYFGGLDPNDLALLLVAFVPVLLVFLQQARGARRLLHLALLLAVLAVTLLTQSRGGLLGLVTVLVLAALFPVARPATGAGRRRPAGVVARLAVLLLLFGVTWVSMPAGVRERLSTVLSLSSDYNVTSNREGRILIWSRNLPLVAARPWGYGAGSSAAVDGKLAGGRYRQLHNMYLEVLVELGVPGFALFLLAFARSWRTLLARRAEDASGTPADVEVRMFRRAVAVSLVGIAVCGFFLSMCYTPCLWLMVTFACVLGRQGGVLETPARRPAGAAS